MGPDDPEPATPARESRENGKVLEDVVLDPFTREKLDSGRWNVSASPVDRGWYGTGYAVKVEPFTNGSVKEITRTGDRHRQWVDTRVADVDKDGNVTPMAGWLDDVPFEKNPDLMYRGISAGEMGAIRETGEIKSTGHYNVGGDSQTGTTSFAIDLRTACFYASGFAPWHLQPTFDEPGYVIAVRRDALPESKVAGGEIDAPPIPADRIVRVVEVRPSSARAGEVEVEPRSYFGEHGGGHRGFQTPPSQSFVFREVPVPADIQQLRDHGPEYMHHVGVETSRHAAARGPQDRVATLRARHRVPSVAREQPRETATDGPDLGF